MFDNREHAVGNVVGKVFVRISSSIRGIGANVKDFRMYDTLPRLYSSWGIRRGLAARNT